MKGERELKKDQTTPGILPIHPISPFHLLPDQVSSREKKKTDNEQPQSPQFSYLRVVRATPKIYQKILPHNHVLGILSKKHSPKTYQPTSDC